jgi:hypothetical protein
MRTIMLIVVASLSITTTSPAVAEPKLVVGFDAELLPKVVDHETEGISYSDTYGTDEPTAYALGAVAEWNVFRWLAVGIAPRYIIFSPASDGTTSTQLDLRARVELGLDIRAWRIYAFGEPGYSFVFTSQNQTPWMMSTTPGAFGVTFGIGARYAAKRDLAITAEVGYEIMQAYDISDPYNGTDTEQQNLLSISLGFVTPVL